MSVVDLETNTVIGSPLVSWDEWPATDPDAPDSTHPFFLLASSPKVYDDI